MASRTSTSTGNIITIAVLLVLSAVGLIASAYFYTKMTNADGRVLSLTSDYNEIIAAGERNSSNVQVALNAARSDRKSLVDFLLSNNNELKRLATGNASQTLEQIRTQTADLTGGSGSLAATISRLEGEKRGLQNELRTTKAQLANNQDTMKAELEKIKQIEANAFTTASEATDRVDSYARDVKSYRTEAEGFEDQVRREVASERSEYQANLRERNQRISELNQQILVLRDQVRRLRGETGDNRVSPIDEYALVDGEVAAVEPGGDLVVITLGSKDKLVIGMVFSVYGNASSIRPTASGEYLPGKAVIEVIGINETSARCRVINASRGNPVVIGDVIANPVYDPSKVYNFVVFGNFDVDNDGIATPYERDALVAIINRWGGKVIDDISGDLDFLVLGRRPEEPLQPAPNAPRVVYDEYLRLKSRVDRYQTLFDEASASSIPVLNENRLRTLIGEFPR